MTTAEQQARDMLDEMGMLFDGTDGPRGPQTMSAGEIVMLANVLRRLAEAEALLREAREVGIAEFWIETDNGGQYDANSELRDRIDAALAESKP